MLLPRRIVSGERATLAVLDVNGRLTPGVTVRFSNGDRFTTDVTGRALFVAPLNPGIMYASIAGRTGKVKTSILSAEEGVSGSANLEIDAVPQIASLSDRFDVAGRGFCGDADANHVTIGGRAALVLASSPSSLTVLPPPELDVGPAKVEISCGKRRSRIFSVTFLSLELKANASALAARERRSLSVFVNGTTAKIVLEARNLSPAVAELAGGNPARRASSGGPENVARFEVTGRQRGNFLISIRLVTPARQPSFLNELP